MFEFSATGATSDRTGGEGFSNFHNMQNCLKRDCISSSAHWVTMIRGIDVSDLLYTSMHIRTL